MGRFGAEKRGPDPDAWRNDSITQKQIDLIDKLDLGYTLSYIEGLTKGEASDIIDEHMGDEDDSIPDSYDVLTGKR